MSICKVLFFLFRGLFVSRSNLILENLALRQQLTVQQRTIKRPKLKRNDRIAIANSRILSVDNGKVTFRYKDSKHGTYIKTMTVNAEEFFRRFLQHALPAGIHKVRY